MSVAIGLGSNLGNPLEELRRAVRRLARTLGSARVSSVFRTEPLGGPAQPDYLNAVVTGTTTLAPPALLGLLHDIESEAGRTRTNERNAPRTLDLDLLLYGNERHATARLEVPHPRLVERRFVLAPLAELVPRRVVPGTGKTVTRLLAEAPAARVARLPERLVTRASGAPGAVRGRRASASRSSRSAPSATASPRRRRGST